MLISISPKWRGIKILHGLPQEEVEYSLLAGPITPWEIEGETVTDFILVGSKITADGDFSHKIKDACLLEEKLWPT